MGSIISAIIDGIISAGIKYLTGLQQRRADMALGAQNQMVKDQDKELSDVQEANKARTDVDSSVAADPGKLRQPDGFERTGN